MVIQDNKALVQRYIEEVFNRKNLAAIDEFLAPDQVDHTLPPGLPPNTEGSKRATAMYLKAFPDVHVTIDEMIAEGDKVAVRFTSRGTQRGSFGPFPSTGRHVTISSYLTARIANGKIVEEWGLDDQLGLLQQLGLVPVAFGFIFLTGLGLGAGLIALVRTLTRR